MSKYDMTTSKNLQLSSSDFELDFEINSNSMEATGDLDTITTIRTIVTKITCKATCTCQCTGFCTALCG